MRTERYDIVIIGSGAGGGTMAHALADSPARILILERGDFVPQEAENWNPDAVWKQLRYQTTERWLDERGAGVPAVHALQRRRQHEVLGQRPCIGCGARTFRRSSTWTASRPPGRSTTTRSRRTTTAPSGSITCTASTAPIRPSPPRGPFPLRADSARRTPWPTIVEQLRAQGLHPSPLPLGIRGRLRALQHLQLVPVQGAREERRRRRAASGPRSSGRTSSLWTNAFARRLLTEPGRRQGRGRRSRDERRDGSRRGVARRRVVRRRELRGAAAAIGERRAPERPREFVGARRPPLHGAPGDHDAGLSSVPEERDGVSEDRRDQRFLPARAGHDVSARPDPVAGTHARRHGADGRAAGCRCRGTNGGWRAASTGWRCRKICRMRRTASRSTRRGGFSCSTGRTTCARTGCSSTEARRILHKLGFWVVMTHSHGAKNTTHQCGTLVFGDDPRESVLDPLLPRARRREPVRRRRVVLPVVGGRQSRR